MNSKLVLTAEREPLLASTFNDAMSRVYAWMAGGLALTATVAVLLNSTPGVAAVIARNPGIFWGAAAAQFILVIAISGGINKMAPNLALALFFLYSGLMGVTFSTLFLAYDLGSIGIAFGVTAAMFTGLAGVGLTTDKDLTEWGPVLIASLFGLIVALLANLVLQSSAIEWAVSVAGVVIFAGLTVYDSQKVKLMTAEAVAAGDAEAAGRVGVLGALELYLDFLNLFLFILSLMGDDD